jgi:hypothetical protein
MPTFLCICEFLNYMMNSDFLILVLNDFVFIVIAMNNYE